MTSTAPTRPTPVTTERIGYGVAVVINAIVLYAIAVWPGWEIVPFLTDEFTQVLGLITLSLLASMVANVVYLAVRAPWVRPLGDLVTTGIGIAVVTRMLQVFPFAFNSTSVTWSALMRGALIVGLISLGVAVVVQFVTLVRAIAGEASGDGPDG